MTKEEFELRRIADALEGIETALAGIAKAESERKVNLSSDDLQRGVRKAKGRLIVKIGEKEIETI